MKKLLQRIIAKFKDSQYVRLIFFFFILFILSGSLVSLFEIGKNDEFLGIDDGLWWAIITFSTTGYGDKVPITFAGRTLAILSIFIGIAAMSVLTGTFASIFVDRNTRARRGLMEFSKLTGHFVLCGWKNHMKDILLDILNATEDLISEKIVIISNIESEKIEELKEVKELSGIRFVRGDYFSEGVLKRANIKDAKKILILADTFESGAVSEVDSKTVITVLTAKSMAKDVYTCAELLDRKFAAYLKSAMCDEILFSRDFSRSMIANATATNGMSHIIEQLLSKKGGQSKISTCAIPSEFIGKEFSIYKSAFGGFRNMLLLGVLENTGSPNKIKIEALRNAQKTSDISQLVTNLQHVKELEVNKPVFIPDDDYMIRDHSMAIILEKKETGN